MLEFGPAFERSAKDGSTGAGGSVAAEWTAIEDWLELEFGASRLKDSARSANSVDLLFKKPFRLSSTAEMMIGLGPEWGRKYDGGSSSTTKSIQFALDFMFWPTRDVGWFVEPTYGYGIGPSRGERSVGASAGILFGF